MPDHSVAALFAGGVVAVPVGGVFVEVASSCRFEDFAHITDFEAFQDGGGWGSGLEVLASFVSAGLVA